MKNLWNTVWKSYQNSLGIILTNETLGFQVTLTKQQEMFNTKHR